MGIFKQINFVLIAVAATLSVACSDMGKNLFYAKGPRSLNYASPIVGRVDSDLAPVTPVWDAPVGAPVNRFTIEPALPVGIQLDPVSGVISGTATESTDPQDYQVTGSNSGGSISSRIRLEVKDLPADLEPSLVDLRFVKTQTKSFTILNRNRAKVTSCEIFGGPSFLSARPTDAQDGCLISGVPAQISDTASFQLRATTRGNPAVSSSHSYLVADLKPAFDPNQLLSAQVGQAARLVLSSSGGAVTGCYGSGYSGLSLTFDSAIGACVLSGTPTAPTAAGTVNYSFRASSFGNSNTNTSAEDGQAIASVRLDIRDRLPDFSSPIQFSLVVGQNYSLRLSPTSMSGALTGCTSTSLNAALSVTFDAASRECRLQGTPTAPAVAQDYTLTAMTYGQSSNFVLRLSVNDINADFGALSPLAFQVGTSSTRHSLVAIRGSLVSCGQGTLPAWISISRNATTNSCDLTLSSVNPPQSTDARGDTGYSFQAQTLGNSSQSVPIIVRLNDRAPSFLDPVHLVFTRGSQASRAFSNQSGSGILTQCEAQDVLPSGLSLGFSGGKCVVQGTPTVLSDAVYGFRGHTQGNSANARVRIQVLDTPPSFGDPGVLSFTVGSIPTESYALQNTSGRLTECKPSGFPVWAETVLDESANACVIRVKSSQLPTSEQAKLSIPARILASTVGNPDVPFDLELRLNDRIPQFSDGIVAQYTLGQTSKFSFSNLSGTGILIHCAAVDPLPAGLAVSAIGGKCEIAGKPTQVVDALYRIRAETVGQFANVSVAIRVKDVPPDFGSDLPSILAFKVGDLDQKYTLIPKSGTLTSCALRSGSPAWLKVVLNTSSNACEFSNTSSSSADAEPKRSITLLATTFGNDPLEINLLTRLDDRAPAFGTPPILNLVKRVPGYAEFENSPGTGIIRSCELASGTIPNGLSLSVVSSKCRISGTPTLAGPFTLNLRVTTLGSSTDVVAELRVRDDLPAFNSLAQQTFRINQPVTPFQILSDAGTGAVVSCSSTTLPSGLSLAMNGERCLLSGTPTQVVARRGFSFSAASYGNSPASAQISIEIQDVPGVIDSGALLAFKVGEVRQYGLPATQGTLTGCRSNASTPSWMIVSLDSKTNSCRFENRSTTAPQSTDSIDVTPFSFVASTLGNLDRNYSGTYKIDDLTPLFSPNKLSATANRGQAGVFSLSQVSNTGIIRQCTPVGTPPLGMSVSLNGGTCRVSGTSNAVGPHSFSIRAITRGASTDVPVELPVRDDAPVFSNLTQINLEVGVARSIDIVNDTGTGALTGCSAPSLPAGLTLSYSATTKKCTLSGTPTVVQPAQGYSFFGTTYLNSGSGTLSILVYSTLAISPLSAVVVAGDQHVFSASGGVGTKTFSLVGSHGSVDATTGRYTAPATLTTPTSVQIKVTDAMGSHQTASVDLKANLKIWSNLALTTIGEPVQFTAGGGIPPYVFKLKSGAAGTVGSSTGLYTPLAAGTATIEVKDSRNTVGAESSVDVTGLLAVSTNAGANPVISTNGQLNLSVVGGLTPYRVELTAGGGSIQTIDASQFKYLAPADLGNATIRVSDARGVSSPAAKTVAVGIQPGLPEIQYGKVALEQNIDSSGNLRYEGTNVRVFPPAVFLETTGPLTDRRYHKVRVNFPRSYDPASVTAPVGTPPRVMLTMNGIGWDSNCNNHDGLKMGIRAANVSATGFDLVLEEAQGGCSGNNRLFNDIHWVAIGPANPSLPPKPKEIVVIGKYVTGVSSPQSGKWSQIASVNFAQGFKSSPFVATGISIAYLSSTCGRNGGFMMFSRVHQNPTPTGFQVRFGGQGNDNDGGCGNSSISEVGYIAIGEPADSNALKPNIALGTSSNAAADAGTTTQYAFQFATPAGNTRGFKNTYPALPNWFYVFPNGWWSYKGEGREVFWQYSTTASFAQSADRTTFDYRFWRSPNSYIPYQSHIIGIDNGGLPQQ